MFLKNSCLYKHKKGRMSMRYKKLGDTGLVVSRMTFGAMTFGQGPLVGEWKTEIGQATADRMVDMSLDAGINFFDTADMYTGGESEIMLGKALGKRRQDVVLATKCGFRSGEALISRGLSHNHVLKAVQASLERLGTDYIDLFILHIPDPYTPLEETARALEDLVRKGWVRYVGASNFPAWKAQKLVSLQEAKGFSRLCTLQMYYSLLGRDIETDLVPMLRENGLGLMTWSPLASGFLTGKYTRENPVPADSRRAKFDFPPVDVDKGYEVVRKLEGIGQDHGASIAQTALAWVLSKDFVTSVMVGANKVSQLEDNLGAADMVLTEEQVLALDGLTEPHAPYPAWMRPMSLDQAVEQGLD